MDQALLSHLRQALGESAVHTDPHTRELHSADALNPARAYHNPPSSAWKHPAVVVEPRSTEEVVYTVRLARRYRTPIVPFGGGTGVMGGTVSEQPGVVVVDLKSMNKIRSLSAEDRVVWAEAGIVLRDLDEALNAEGLLLGHDPWSVPIATLGGAISTNGVGYRATKYGSMGAQVLGLEVVLPTGEVLTTRAVPKYASGPNLNHLFIGAEGTLGIITAAAVRVHRTPEERRFATVSFADFETGFRAVSELFALGVRPALTDLTEETSADEHGERRILLYLAFEGYREEVEAQERRTLMLCNEYGGTDIGPEETRQYWEQRHHIALRYQEEMLPLTPEQRWSHPRRPDDGVWDYLHVALPLSRVLEYRRQAVDIGRAHGVEIRECAVWTEPELFSMIMVGTSMKGNPNGNSFAETVDAVLRLAQDMGGTMEYCHGVGIKLGPLAEREWGSGLDTARRIKRAL
ncbi:MAG: FAD-binding oxidoreductase, partial [Chloroflexi bacterium]|nr:FAD-binding oxidoreductase [Chloroflexota bacterium]